MRCIWRPLIRARFAERISSLCNRKLCVYYILYSYGDEENDKIKDLLIINDFLKSPFTILNEELEDRFEEYRQYLYNNSGEFDIYCLSLEIIKTIKIYLTSLKKFNVHDIDIIRDISKKIDTLDKLKYIILGIIQGLTEPLPISSSGHLVIFKNLFNLDSLNDLNFEIIVNFASFLAISFIYRKDIIKLIKDSINYLKTKNYKYYYRL